MYTVLFSHMHFDSKQAWKLMEKLILTTENRRGILTVLWHNNMQEDYPGT